MSIKLGFMERSLQQAQQHMTAAAEKARQATQRQDLTPQQLQQVKYLPEMLLYFTS